MMMMAAATDLLVIFLALEVLSLAGLRADRHPPRRARPARRRRSSTSCSARSRARSSSTASRSRLRYHGSTRHRGDRPRALGAGDRRARTAGAARRRPAGGRLRVQGVGGAVPHVDAGRLRRRADDRHRVHVHGRQGGGVRRVRARVPVAARAAAGALDSGALRHCRRRR